MIVPENVSMWISLIGNFGFPIALTVYLFIRFERKIDKLESVIMELSEVIKSLHFKKGG
ncbi:MULTISPECIES: YvrJ family protein [unclassified Lysinibacillus]|uniref:YvrJ family protein n=1 Tax=unclassified Lysinibacillus TaxID=2636778 RepID=UPI0020133B61|nr:MULTISPECIES: YvrJ family protein [unclassified Lysinibacillus]MCL1697368.1 YvrJ family protein [Lysinibacillus sp. BPa_S21]MCL1702172.1 YvrJ family protein [Lysinibacillus sp. Bpr_S20]